MAQVTPGITAATGVESGPNMICAFQEGDAQFPCDPGCCEGGDGSGSGDGSRSGDGSGSGDGTIEGFPIWAIILLITVGAMLMLIAIVFAVRRMKKMSTNK